MTEIDLFAFYDYWWMYIAFMGLVLLLLVLDLGVFHRKAHEVTIREATVWSIVPTDMTTGDFLRTQGS